MKRLLPALVLASVAALPFVSQGCIVSSCGDNCTQFETPVRFEAAAESDSEPYTDGLGIKVVGVNGNITVTPGTSSNVEVTYKPFILDKKDNEENAKAHMAKNLITDISTTGSDIVIRTDRASGSSSTLGADIVVKLPAGFDGRFEIDQNNGEVSADLGSLAATATVVKNIGAGSVTMHNAVGPVDITADVGDVDVSIKTWGTAKGTIHAGNGQIDVEVPSDIDGTITLNCDDLSEISVSGVPSSWTGDTEDPQSKAFTAGTGVGAALDVVNDFGDIHLNID